MNFKNRTFFLESLAPGDFGAPGCHPITLTDLVKTALASRDFVKTICMISEGYRTHRAVTGPMSFKKSRRFVRKSCSRVFGEPGCYPSTVIDPASPAVASKDSLETICMNTLGYITHRAVTGPMSFKKSRSFVGKSCSRGFGASGCHPSTLIDIVHNALASNCSVKTICLISEGYRTHRAVTGPMSFKNHDALSENRAPGFLGNLAISKHFI